jgi:hypothetical protein
VDGARVATGADEAFLLGYAQDYTGYLLLPDDWANGGYEAASNFWGPRQGVYLADTVISVASKLFDSSKELNFEPVGPLDFQFEEGSEYEAGISIDAGQIEVDVPAEVQANDIVRFTFTGGDPWLGTPTIYLETKSTDSDEFETFMSGGRLLDVESYRTHVLMKPEPSWEETKAHPAEGRRFLWTVELRTTVPIAGADQKLGGLFRFHVEGKALDSNKSIVNYTIDSGGFTLDL